MNKVLITVVFGGLLAACNPTTVASVAQQVQPTLIPVCNAAMALSSVAGPIAPWIIAGCAGAESVDKLAADPSSTAWVNGLISAVVRPNA